MKKKIFFISVFIGGVFAISSCYAITSCRSHKPTGEMEQFISDRTFSICGQKTVGSNIYSSRGTGWIINKRNDIHSNPYEYWIATNWHVVNGFEGVDATWSYSDYEFLGTNNSWWNDYQSFAGFSLEDPNNFTYDGNLKHAIDFRICSVNFGPTISKHYQDRLDRINRYYEEHNHHINIFPGSGASYSKPYYIGGYPVVNGVGAWTFHEMNNLVYIPQYYQGGPWSHWIDGKDEDTGATIQDISPQYQFSRTDESWMPGGASGSLILNSKKEICGIYWGGWVFDGSNKNKFMPCASIFHSQDPDKNFIPNEMI